MKKLFSFLLFSALLIVAKAQENSTAGFHFAGGINLGLPMGDFSDSHSIGLGIELQPEYSLSDKFSIYGSAGYTNFFGKNEDLGGQRVKWDNVGLLPILAGARVYVVPQFFIGAKAGLGILTGGGDSESAFDYQPQVGYNGNKFQLNLGYNGLSKNGETLSNLSVSFLYKF